MIAFIVVHLDGQVRAYSATGVDVTPARGLDIAALRRFAPDAQVIAVRSPDPSVSWALHEDSQRYAK